MENQSEALLRELHKATQMGLEATRMVAPKVTDPALKKEVNRQETCYQELLSKTEGMLSKKGETPEAGDWGKKAMLWGSIQLNTIADASNSHIAEMMINGTTMGIVDMTKTVNELADVDSGVRGLAKDFINCEERHIEALKKHL